MVDRSCLQGLVEIPYILVQTIIFCVITFFMINYDRTAGKIHHYLYVYYRGKYTILVFFGFFNVSLSGHVFRVHMTI